MELKIFSFLDYSFLVFINTTDFSVLILCFAILLSLFISTEFFLWNP